MSEPVFSDTYTGPRYTYGLRYRPMQIGAQPARWIIGSVKTAPIGRYTYGTVEYPFELTEDTLRAYEMERVIEPGETAERRRTEQRKDG